MMSERKIALLTQQTLSPSGSWRTRSTKVIGIVLLSFPAMAAARTIDVQSWYGNDAGASNRGDVQSRGGDGGKSGSAQWIVQGKQSYRTEVKAPPVKQVQTVQPKQSPAATAWPTSAKTTAKRAEAARTEAAKAVTAKAVAHAKSKAKAPASTVKARKVSTSGKAAGKNVAKSSAPAARRVSSSAAPKAATAEPARRVEPTEEPVEIVAQETPPAPAVVQDIPLPAVTVAQDVEPTPAIALDDTLAAPAPTIALDDTQPVPAAVDLPGTVAASEAEAPPPVADIAAIEPVPETDTPASSIAQVPAPSPDILATADTSTSMESAADAEPMPAPTLPVAPAFVDRAATSPVPALAPPAAPYPTGLSPAAGDLNPISAPHIAAQTAAATPTSIPMPISIPQPAPVQVTTSAPALAVIGQPLPAVQPGQAVVYVPIYVQAPTPIPAPSRSPLASFLSMFRGQPGNALPPMIDAPQVSSTNTLGASTVGTPSALPALNLGTVPSTAAAQRSGIGAADVGGDDSGGPCRPMLTGAVPCADPGDVRAVAMDNYRFIPSRIETEADIASTPAQREIVQANQDGDYGLVARKGEAALATGPADPALRMIVANSLAWTGKLDRADAIYKSLLNTSYRTDALAAMASVMRWRGKNYLAIPMYRAILAEKPDHADARAGLEESLDAIRPMLRTEIGAGNDIDQVRSAYVSVRYREHVNDGQRYWELEARDMAAHLPGGPRANQLSLIGRAQAYDLPMQPMIELTLSDRVYGLFTISPIENLPVQVHVGRVNWGEQVRNPRALDQRLSAGNIGGSGVLSGRYGSASFALDQYAVSDGNRLSTGMVRYSPSFGLFTKHIKPVIGMEFREAKFNSPSYWSPAEGYGTGFVGLEGEWAGEKLSLNIGVQRGTRLWGDAGSGWGGSLSAGYKINKDWKVGGGAWAISNIRDAQPYRARTGYLYLERRW